MTVTAKIIEEFGKYYLDPPEDLICPVCGHKAMHSEDPDDEGGVGC